MGPSATRSRRSRRNSACGWFEAAGLDWEEPSRGPMFNDSSHMMQAAIEGQGIALARSSLIGDDERNGVLVRLFDIVLRSPKRYFLVYSPRLADSPKLLAFKGWLLTELSGEKNRVRPAFSQKKRV